MNWEAISTIGELIGAAAVVIALYYLAVETRNNTKALRASTIWNAETIFGSINYAHAQNPEFAALASRAFAVEARREDFNAVEISQLQFAVRGAMQYFQAQWSMWREGVLPDELWERRRKFVRGMMSLDLLGKLVEAEVKQHTFAEAFVEDITSQPAAGPVTIGLE